MAKAKNKVVVVTMGLEKETKNTFKYGELIDFKCRNPKCKRSKKKSKVTAGTRRCPDCDNDIMFGDVDRYKIGWLYLQKDLTDGVDEIKLSVEV
jgi:hypothetical protein